MKLNFFALFQRNRWISKDLAGNIQSVSKLIRKLDPTKMSGSVPLITDVIVQVASLAWNHEGTRLLTAGEVLQMWKYNEKTKFEVSQH